MPNNIDDLSIAAWFQLASSNQFNFENAKKRDVIIRTTDDTQNILIGPTPNPSSSHPSLLTLSSNNLLVSGDIFLENGSLNRINQIHPLNINGISISNESIRTQDIIINNHAKIRNVLDAKEVHVNGNQVFNRDGELQTTSIVSESIDGNKIAKNTITNENIVLETLKSESLANNSIIESKIAAESVTTEKIKNDSITSEKIVQYSITNKKLDDDSIDTRTLKSNSVSTQILKDKCITNDKIINNIELRGDPQIHGSLSINTIHAFSDDPTNFDYSDMDAFISQIPKKDDDSSLDVYRKMSLLGRDKKRSYLFTQRENIGINNDDPNFTLDVKGNINCTSGLFQNGDPLLFTQWFSTPSSFTNCNLVYMNGFVGINQFDPEHQLHVGGSIQTMGELIFKDNLSKISHFDSNLGISISEPQATLDIGGNVAIDNTIIIDKERNIHDIKNAHINKLFIENNHDQDFSLDVKGNVQMNTDSFLFNQYHMVISSKGVLDSDNDYYYLIAHIKKATDHTNFGSLVIDGVIGEKNYDRNCHFQSIITNRNLPSHFNLEECSISSIFGGDPFIVSQYTDLELYERNDRELYVFLKTTPNSMFDLTLKSGDLLKSINAKWYETKSRHSPEQQISNLTKIKSLINNLHHEHLDLNGKKIVYDLEVRNDFKLNTSFINDGNLLTKGQFIRGISYDMKRLLFDIQREKVDNDPNIILSANMYKKDDSLDKSWYLHNGDFGGLQLKLKCADAIDNNSYFYFQGTNTITNQDDSAMNTTHWVSINQKGLGVHVDKPNESLDILGNMSIKDGKIKFVSIIDDNLSSDYNFLEAFEPTLTNGKGVNFIFGKKRENSEYAQLKYIKDQNDHKRLSLGFSHLDLLNISDNDCIGLNIVSPKATLHVNGNVKQDDGMFVSLKNENKSANIHHFSWFYTSFSTWEKIALLKANFSGNIRNRGYIFISGSVSYNGDDFGFKANMFFNNVSKDSCSQSVTLIQNNENLLKNVFDIILLCDQSNIFHLYARMNTSNVLLQLDVHISQYQGQGILIYGDQGEKNRKKLENQDFRNDNDFNGSSPLFSISLKDDAKVFTKYTSGNFTIGDITSRNKLDIDGGIGADYLNLNNGHLVTRNNNDFIVNGTAIVNKSGHIIGSNLPRESLDFDKLSLGARDDIWTNINNRLISRNLNLFSDRVSFFSSAFPSEPNILEVGTKLVLTSNIGREDIPTKVNLTTGLNNTLGINVDSPKHTLDINGDLNITGQLLKDGKLMEGYPFTYYDNIIQTSSNMAIGKGFEDTEDPFNNSSMIDESLTIFDSFSLSNHSSKTIMTTRNDRLGINESDPNSTLDVNGGISVKNVEIIDENRNIDHIETLNTTVLHASLDRVGIGKKSPNFRLDVKGDINFDGKLYQNGIPAANYSNQWDGENNGINYSSFVGIGTDIPNSEILSVKNSMSLSNESGKVIQKISNDASLLEISKPVSTDGLIIRNNQGNSIIYSHGSNLGLGFPLPISSKIPKTTLDINGNIGINGTEIITENISVSNIHELYTDFLTVKNNNVGINTRNPINALTVNGDIGFHNENTVLSVRGNHLNVLGNGFVASNISIPMRKNESGIHIKPQNDVTKTLPLTASDINNVVNHDLNTSLLIKGLQGTAVIKSDLNDVSSYLAFYDNHNHYGFIGLEGDGLYGKEEKGTMSIISKKDVRFVTQNEEHMRILENGNIGIHTAFPSFSLDIGGNGIGIAGEQFVDIERNAFVNTIQIEDVLKTRNINPNVISVHPYQNINLRLTGIDGGVRTTDKNSGDFATFSNLLNENSRGSVVMIAGSNIYFNGTNNTGGNSYLNIAYQPIRKNTSLSGNSNINVDTYIWDEKNANNLIGNIDVIGNHLELINPKGHVGHTSFRLRNWNPYNIESSASNLDKNFFEMCLENDKSEEKLKSQLKSDHNIEFILDNKKMMEISLDNNVKIPESSSFRIHSLSTGGVKQVYADENGRLTPNSSDLRMKMNIQKMEYGLKDVLDMNPVEYNWNKYFCHPITSEKIDLTKERGKQKELGLIAQEIQKVIPESVGQNVDSTLFVDYGKLVPVLIKSIQELAKENKQIKSVLKKHSLW